jgi:hypothetical protein
MPVKYRRIREKIENVLIDFTIETETGCECR